MKKRLLSMIGLLLILCVCVSVSSCSFKTKEKETIVRVGGLKGPTSIGMAKIWADAEGKEDADYSFLIAGSADELTPKLLQGELDIAAVPANLAAVLYQRSQGEIRALGINTLGVQYIVCRGEEIASPADLRGKTLWATGKGTVNEYNMRYLFAQSGVDLDRDVNVEWKSEPTEVVALLKTSESGVAMLPQPYVTIAQTQVEGLDVAFGLNDLWTALDNGTAMVTGVFVVRGSWAEAHPEAVKKFLADYRASAAFVNENPAEAADVVERMLGIEAAVATRAIPYCAITCVTGAEMKEKLSGYLGILYEQNPAAVGGQMPGEAFYLSLEE